MSQILSSPIQPDVVLEAAAAAADDIGVDGHGILVKPNQILNFGCAPPARLSYVIFVDRTAASQQNHYVFLCLQKL